MTNTTEKPKRKTPEKESPFRGTTIPLCASMRKAIGDTQKYYDLVNGVDAVRFSVVIANRLIEVAVRPRAKSMTATKIVAAAVDDLRKWQVNRVAGKAPTMEPKFMRLRDRDFDRIERVREYLIEALGVESDKLTQSDAVQFSLTVEEAYRLQVYDTMTSAG